MQLQRKHEHIPEDYPLPAAGIGDRVRRTQTCSELQLARTAVRGVTQRLVNHEPNRPDRLYPVRERRVHDQFCQSSLARLRPSPRRICCRS